MLISIGILARNEEKVIEATLTSLLRQSVFRQISCDLPDTEWEIVVVPNGCTDATSAVAQRVLEELVHQTASEKQSGTDHGFHPLPSTAPTLIFNKHHGTMLP